MAKVTLTITDDGEATVLQTDAEPSFSLDDENLTPAQMLGILARAYLLQVLNDSGVKETINAKD